MDCVGGDTGFEATVAVLFIPDVCSGDLSPPADAAMSLTGRKCDVGGIPSRKQHCSSFA